MKQSRVPIYAPDVKANNWVLMRDFVVSVDGKSWVVPTGFESDMASIPRFAWWLVGHPATPRIEAAATLHDYLYTTHEVSRREADRLFLVLMKRNNCESPWLKWLAVRLFGWWAWRKGSRK